MTKKTNRKIVKQVEGFTYTTAIKKLRRLKKRIKRIPGGTSAGKTYGILPILIDKAIKTKNLEISVISESIPHLRKGALKDFLKIMKSTGRYIDDNFNRTLLTYTFSNGSYMEFFSADQEDKVRGPRRNILYINECNNISFEIYHQLSIRTDKEIWIDYNPTHEFWADTELRDDPDVDTLVLTYKDNEALSESIIREIEKSIGKAFYEPYKPLENLFHESNIKNQYWANWWKVYGLGETGSLEGVVFSNWQPVSKLPKDAALLGYGMDFGFSNDPSTLIALYKYNDRIIAEEKIYRTGMTGSDLVKEMDKLSIYKQSEIFADSSRPDLIEEIRRHGYNIRKAESKDILYGLDLMQSHKFLITSDSINTINEFRYYQWAKDKTGNKLNKPIDDMNHSIDAIRYFTVSRLKTQNSTWEPFSIEL